VTFPSYSLFRALSRRFRTSSSAYGFVVGQLGLLPICALYTPLTGGILRLYVRGVTNERVDRTSR